jgi:hypothetical protein
MSLQSVLLNQLAAHIHNVPRVEKFPDGMSNKAFLFTIQDGAQVVGKVPNPNAGRAHYTTASEVATMDFVSRIRLLVLSKIAPPLS